MLNKLFVVNVTATILLEKSQSLVESFGTEVPCHVLHEAFMLCNDWREDWSCELTSRSTCEELFFIKAFLLLLLLIHRSIKGAKIDTFKLFSKILFVELSVFGRDGTTI